MEAIRARLAALAEPLADLYRATCARDVVEPEVELVAAALAGTPTVEWMALRVGLAAAGQPAPVPGTSADSDTLAGFVGRAPVCVWAGLALVAVANDSVGALIDLIGLPGCPAELLDVLADDPHRVVRCAVADAGRTRGDTVDRLMRDPDSLVACTARSRRGRDRFGQVLGAA